MAATPGKRVFGELEKRKSATTGKVTGWRARYTGPDLERHRTAMSLAMFVRPGRRIWENWTYHMPADWCGRFTMRGLGKSSQ